MLEYFSNISSSSAFVNFCLHSSMITVQALSMHIPVSVDIKFEFNSLRIPFFQELRVHLAYLTCQCDLPSVVIFKPQIDTF